MSKARVLVTENILLFKYQKQAAKAALNERCPYVVTYCLRENREYTKSFVVSRDTLPIAKKVSDREFYWNANDVFFTRFGI